MKTLKFKTTINCAGCIAKVTPALNALEGINKLEVDVNDPSKILTVETSIVEADEIKAVLAKVGFKGELVA